MKRGRGRGRRERTYLRGPVCVIVRCMNNDAKYEELKALLRSLGRVVVCFSGGVDSTLLLKAAVDAVGKEDVLALVARSDTYPEREIAEALSFADALGVSNLVIETREMTDESYLQNAKDRCYHCKRHLFSAAKEVAREEGYDHVLEGSNVDDQGDYRPGRRAGAEAGVISPLLRVGLSKADIRRISKDLGLPTHNKPSLACLASRIPYGTRIEAPVLGKIERSEGFLRSLGFRQVRVRYHGHVARIEVGEEDLEKAVATRKEITDALEKIGFLYVTLDLRGYRTGSMNDVLPQNGRG